MDVVKPEGLAAAASDGAIERGQPLVAINGRDLGGLSFEQVKQLLVQSPRPVTLAFQDQACA